MFICCCQKFTIYFYHYFNNSISSHKNDKHNKNDIECSICLDTIQKGVQMNCTHVYHIDCITQWNVIKNQCPLCRKPLMFLKNTA